MRKKGRRKVRIGVVTSAKMDKSIIVTVERYVKHSLYKRYVRRRTKLVAHDENNECKAGDQVRIMETRPLSKTKRWRLTEIVRKAK